MFSHFASPDFAANGAWALEPDPRVAVLIEALRDCVHPRSERLRSQLQGHVAPERLAHLRAEVFNLLAMSFGPDEAERRLRPLQ